MENLFHFSKKFVDPFKILDMKTIQRTAIIGFMVLSIHSISAQYGNNGYGGSNRMNQMNSGIPSNNHESSPKEIPVEVTVGKIMERLKTELTLDELQVIAISNIMTESVKNGEVLRKKEMSQEDKIKEMQAEAEATDIKIMYLLYKNQKEKYSTLIEDRKKRFEALSDKRNR